MKPFDTIYHEHFSYFSLLSAETSLSHGLTVYDVEEIPPTVALCDLREARRRRDEASNGTCGEPSKTGNYLVAWTGQSSTRIQREGEETKRRLLEFLINAKRAGKSIAGYVPRGREYPSHYCGIRTDSLTSPSTGIHISKGSSCQEPISLFILQRRSVNETDFI